MRAVARVKVVVEVQLTQPWGDDCTLGQLNKQAREDAILQVQRLILGSVPRPEPGLFQIVQNPVVLSVLTEG